MLYACSCECLVVCVYCHVRDSLIAMVHLFCVEGLSHNLSILIVFMSVQVQTYAYRRAYSHLCYAPIVVVAMQPHYMCFGAGFVSPVVAMCPYDVIEHFVVICKCHDCAHC